MKKYILFLILILLCYFYYPRNDYIELNHIKIIREISISCEDTYQVQLKEVSLEKKDKGFDYQYHDYFFEDKNLDKIKNKMKKTFYLKKVKVLKTNCDDVSKILDVFQIHPSKIEME